MPKRREENTGYWCRPCGNATGTGSSASSCAMISGWPSAASCAGPGGSRSRGRKRQARGSLRHAPRVRCAGTFCCKAYGRLPDKLRDCTKEQQAFSDRFIAGLALDGKVISSAWPCLPRWSRASSGRRHITGRRRDGGDQGHLPRRDVHRVDRPAGTSPAPEGRAGCAGRSPPRTGVDIKGQVRSRDELLNCPAIARPRRRSP